MPEMPKPFRNLRDLMSSEAQRQAAHTAEAILLAMSEYSPGQRAYAAWEAALHAQGRLTTRGQWPALAPTDQAAWEAAAQAVLAQAGTTLTLDLDPDVRKEDA